ncbi:MAG: hypothetical protein M0D57_21290 [Sphingobacteriales bacterium JAD_PAG50586_3]|nr:MAG: hypothetical protein M0D57_21290 [Sphingobacteriales bacterium JAD_PAG50586_3]
MRSTLAILFFYLCLGHAYGTTTLVSNVGIVGDTSHVKTALRIILPEDKGGWDYFFQVDGMGTPHSNLQALKTLLL